MSSSGKWQQAVSDPRKLIDTTAAMFADEWRRTMAVPTREKCVFAKTLARLFDPNQFCARLGALGGMARFLRRSDTWNGQHRRDECCAKIAAHAWILS
jgi:hypothetical protein